MSYHEEFVSGSGTDGAYVCHLVLSDPDGFTLQTGGPAVAFVAPAAREHGVPGAAALVGTARMAPDAQAAAWAAALAPTRIADMYAAYKAEKERQKQQPRSQEDWWGVEGKRGGARFTVEGCLGEYQADKLFAAQGHTKLNHEGKLIGLLDPPRGRGLDGGVEKRHASARIHHHRNQIHQHARKSS